MHALEIGLAAMQDGHEVDDCIGLRDQAGELEAIQHIGLHHLDRGQRLQVPGTRHPAGGHDHAPAAAVVAVDQLFDDVPADEARAAQDQDVVAHMVDLS